MGDECFDDTRGIFTTMLNNVKDTRREPSVPEDLADEMVGAGTQFGGFETFVRGWRKVSYTTVLPQAIGAQTARKPSNKAAFHGAMPTTTPYGSFNTRAMPPTLAWNDRFLGTLLIRLRHRSFNCGNSRATFLQHAYTYTNLESTSKSRINGRLLLLDLGDFIFPLF